MILPAGNPSSKLWIAQEFPTSQDLELGQSITGKCAEFLTDCGVNLEATYRFSLYDRGSSQTNHGRMAKPGGTTDSTPKLSTPGLPLTLPNCILALGTAAARELAGVDGILKYRGSILQGIGSLSAGPGGRPVKVIPTLHPLALNRPHGSDAQAPKHYYKYLVQGDIQKALAEAAFPEIKRRRVQVTIAKTGAALWNWLVQHKPRIVPRHATIDIESFRTIPICIAISFDGIHVVVVPLLNMDFALHWQMIPESELLYMWKLVDNVLSDPDTFIGGQNLKYDWQKIYHAMGFRPAKFWADSMHLANLLNPEYPKSLGFIASYLTDEPYWKDEGKDYWKEGGFKRNTVDQLLIYNGKDAAVDHEIISKQIAECSERGLADFYERQVRPLHDIYCEIEREGMAYDFEEKAKLLLKYLLLKADKEAELFGILGRVFNWRSPKQMPALFHDELKFPVQAKLDEDTLVGYYCNHTKGADGERKRRIIDLILDLKKIDKALQFMHMLPDWDDRYRTVFNPAQAETGRSSTSIQDPPTRIKVKDVYRSGRDWKDAHLGLAFHTITKHGELGSDVRRIFVPGPDHVFMEIDLSQAEARIVAHLAGDEDTLKLFDTTDIHSLTTTWIFGIPYEAVTKELRFVGKTCRHAGNYGMGKRRLMMEIMTGAKKYGLKIPPVSEKEAGEILNRFHANTPKIRGVFHARVQGELANNNRTLVNAYGRPRQFLDYWDDKLFQEGYAQIPQSTVRDKLIEVMVNMKKIDWMCGAPRIVIEPHDALILKVHKNNIDITARKMKELFESPIDFAKCSIKRGLLTIPCEIKVGENYKDLKDYKIGS